MARFETETLLADDENGPAKIWNSNFISIFIANGLLYLGQQMSNSILPLYAQFLNEPSTVVGIVASSYAITALIFKLISAPAIDTFNRKYLLAGAIGMMAVSFIGFNLSTSAPWLIFFRLLQGVGQAFTATTCLALATDATPKSKIATGIGYFSIAQAMMQAIGPAVGLKLHDVIGFNWTFVFGAGIMVLAVIFTLSLKNVQTSSRKFRISMDSMLAKEAIVPAIILFFLSISFFTITSFLAIFGKGSVGSNIGFFFTVNALTLVVTRPLVGKLADRFGHVNVMIPTMVIFGISLYLISVSTTLPMFLLAAVLNAFGYGACQPAVQSLCMKRVPKERRGAASCTSYIGTDLGSLIGPVVAGALVGTIGFVDMWRVMALPILIAIAFVLAFRKNLSRK